MKYRIISKSEALSIIGHTMAEVFRPKIGPWLSIDELASLKGVTTQITSENVARMEADGWITTRGGLVDLTEYNTAEFSLRCAAERDPHRAALDAITAAGAARLEKKLCELETPSVTADHGAYRVIAPYTAEWRALREYFIAEGQPVAVMDEQACRGVGWTAPIDWPPARAATAGEADARATDLGTEG